MIVNIAIGNNPSHLWDAIGDLVWFIKGAIEAVGHTVVVSDYRAIDRGINLFIDRFYQQAELAVSLELRNVRYGFVVTEHISEDGVLNFGAETLTEEMTNPIRHSEFVWCLIEESLPFCLQLNTESHFLPLGFVPSIAPRPPRMVYKDIDFVVTGRSSERRLRILRELENRGFQTGISNHAPRFIRDGLLERSKFNLSLQKVEGQRIVSATRICHSILHRVPVILELNQNISPSVYSTYCLQASMTELVDRCVNFAREIDVIDFANCTFERFAAEMNMVKAMGALMDRIK